MEANKSGEMKTVLTDRGGSLLWGITLATDGDLCPLFQFKQGQISSFYLVFLSLLCDISARFVLHIDLSCLSLLVSPGHGG